MHDIEVMCNEHGRQLLLIWFMNYLPLTKFHIVNSVWAITPKPYGIYLWKFTDVCMTLRRCVMKWKTTLAYLVYELSALTKFHNNFMLCRPQLNAPSDWRPGGRVFNHCRGRQHSFVEIDREIFSTVILSLLLIQEGQLSVSGERMCTILVNRLED